MKSLPTRENEANEYKQSVSELKDGLISLAAMLNANRKGNLYIGVDDRGMSTNRLKLTNGIERDIKRAFKEHFDPYIVPNIKEISLQSGTAIQIYVSGNDTPYSAYGISKFRVGASNENMPKNKYRQLIEEEIAKEWESKLSKYSIKDLNNKTFNSYLKSIIRNKRLKLDNKSPSIVLRKLGLLNGNKLLNAGAVMFVDKTNIKCQVAEFNGTNKTNVNHIDEFEGNIIENIDNINAYINRHTIGKTIMPKSVNEHRIEITELPQNALREALFNSFVHKNYVWDKTSNQVGIYWDRVEIFNPGTYISKFSITDYAHGKGISVLRNKLIANAFYRSGDIETWASGIKRIYDECKSRNIRVTFDDKNPIGFTVIFWRNIPKSQLQNSGFDSITKSIIRYVNDNKSINKIQTMELLNYPERKAKYILAKLVKYGYLKIKGKTNKLVYVLP